MNWAEWAPTVVSVIVGVYTAGVEVGSRRAMRRVQIAQGKQLERLDERVNRVDSRVSVIEGRLFAVPARG